MRPKAISTVIASILMLMIVIGLAGTSYLFISGTFTSKTATAFEIIESFNDTVTIRNDGDAIIKSMTASLDGNSLDSLKTVFDLNKDLIAYWKFNEDSGTSASDASDNENTGTVIGATYTGGNFGNGINFDGTQHADFSSLNSKVSSKETIVFWLLPKVTTSGTVQASDKGPGVGGCCIGQWGSFQLDNRFNYQVYCNPWRPVTTQPLQPNKWYQIAVVIDVGNALKIYVNGALEGTYSGLPCNNVFGMFILGAHHTWDGSDNIADGFNGIIDDVRVYNKALNDQEVKALYEVSGETINNPGELGRIKFNLPTLTKGTHTLRMCTSSMCNIAFLTIT